MELTLSCMTGGFLGINGGGVGEGFDLGLNGTSGGESGGRASSLSYTDIRQRRRYEERALFVDRKANAGRITRNRGNSFRRYFNPSSGPVS